MAGQYAGVTTKLVRERAMALARLDRFEPSGERAPEEAQQLALTMAHAPAGDTAHKALFDAMKGAWETYRKAERELWSRALPKRLTEPGLEQAIDAALTKAERIRVEWIAQSTEGR